MSGLSVAYCVVTYASSVMVETLHSIPKGSRLLVVDNSVTGWPLSKAWNYAIDRLCNQEGYDYALVMNDDIVIRPDTAQLLAEAINWRRFSEERPFRERELLLVSGYNVRDVNPAIEMPGGAGMPPSPSRPNAAGPPHDPWFGAEDLGKFRPRWGEGPDFSCWLAGAKLLQVMGPFDEGFEPCYFEDNDTHWRLRQLGFEGCSYAPYFHYGSMTTKTSAERRQFIADRFPRLAKRYEAKWGGGPGHEVWTSAWNGGRARHWSEF